MAVHESSATALVRFTGLGIIIFNRERRRGEIAVLRDNKHTLAIRIQKPVFQEGSGNDAIAYQDVVSYQKLPKENVRIEIKASGNPAVNGFEIYQPGEFDRLDSPDGNDFRWVVNMNNLHSDTTPNTASAAEIYPLTRMYIDNGLFYSQKLDRGVLFEKVERDAGGQTTNRELFGNVAETVGVKLEGDEVNFTIRIGEREETHSLKHVSGLPYRIEIKNMDYSDNAVYSDMADYYKYLAGADGKKCDFERVVEAEGDGEAVNQIEFCHPVVVTNPQTIDDLPPGT